MSEHLEVDDMQTINSLTITWSIDDDAEPTDAELNHMVETAIESVTLHREDCEIKGITITTD